MNFAKTGWNGHTYICKLRSDAKAPLQQVARVDNDYLTRWSFINHTDKQIKERLKISIILTIFISLFISYIGYTTDVIIRFTYQRYILNQIVPVRIIFDTALCFNAPVTNFLKKFCTFHITISTYKRLIKMILILMKIHI